MIERSREGPFGGRKKGARDLENDTGKMEAKNDS